MTSEELLPRMQRASGRSLRDVVLILVDPAQSLMPPGDDKAVVLALLRKRGSRGVTSADFEGRIMRKFVLHVKWLRSQGYEIDLVQGRRYVLTQEPKPYVSAPPPPPPEPPSDQGSLFDG